MVFGGFSLKEKIKTESVCQIEICDNWKGLSVCLKAPHDEAFSLLKKGDIYIVVGVMLVYAKSVQEKQFQILTRFQFSG